jgi:hypothetical protein
MLIEALAKFERQECLVKVMVPSFPLASIMLARSSVSLNCELEVVSPVVSIPIIRHRCVLACVKRENILIRLLNHFSFPARVSVEIFTEGISKNSR